MSTTNSAELYLINRKTLTAFGDSTANGPTAESVQLARENIRHAKRLLAQTEIEYADRRKAEKRRERARKAALTPELTD